MRLLRLSRWSRLLALLALVQIVAPSVAAIADAWRLDQRASFAHMESETSSSCVVVHAHDCLLCSIATAPTGTLPAPSAVPVGHAQRQHLPDTDRNGPTVLPCATGAPRAPPVRIG